MTSSTPPEEAAGHVLIAEDNATNVEVLSSMLELLGYTFVVAKSGEHALTVLRENPDVQLILMDVQMPMMDGFAATEAIRREEAAEGRARTPIIAVSAHAFREERLRAAQAGMDGYLTKPIDLDELEEALGRFLASPQPELPPSSPRDALLDDRAIAQLRALDILDRAIDAYVEDCTRGMAAVRKALAAGDAAGMKEAAHGLRGSSLTFGANRAAELAARLERSDPHESVTIAEELLAALDETLRAATALGREEG